MSSTHLATASYFCFVCTRDCFSGMGCFLQCNILECAECFRFLNFCWTRDSKKKQFCSSETRLMVVFRNLWWPRKQRKGCSCFDSRIALVVLEKHHLPIVICLPNLKLVTYFRAFSQTSLSSGSCVTKKKKKQQQ